MKPNYTEAKKAALRVLSARGITEPPVNPVEIARTMGVKVHFVSFSDETLKTKISGFYDAEEDAIYVNEDEFPLRQTFTVAHELGHRILHKDWAASSEYKVLLREEGSGDDPREKEANVFAANLLVPKHMLDAYYEYANSPEKLSELFAVSIPTIRNRLSFEYGV